MDHLSAQRQPLPAVVDRLLAEPWRFRFFQAMRPGWDSFLLSQAQHTPRCDLVYLLRGLDGADHQARSGPAR